MSRKRKTPAPPHRAVRYAPGTLVQIKSGGISPFDGLKGWVRKYDTVDFPSGPEEHVQVLVENGSLTWLYLGDIREVL